MEVTKKITFSLTEEEKEAFVTVNTVLENLSKELRRMDGNKALLLNCDRDFTKITADEIDSITRWLDWFPDADIYTEKLEKRYWQIPFFCYTIIVRRTKRWRNTKMPTAQKQPIISATKNLTATCGNSDTKWYRIKRNKHRKMLAERGGKNEDSWINEKWKCVWRVERSKTLLAKICWKNKW